MSGVGSLGLGITAAAQEESSWQFRRPGLADVLPTVYSASGASAFLAGASRPQAQWLQNGCQAAINPPHITGLPCPPANFCLPVRQVMPLWCKSTQITANRCGNPARWHCNARPSRATPSSACPFSRACGEAQRIMRQRQRNEVALSSGRIYLKVKPSNTNDSQGQKAPSTTRSIRLKYMYPRAPYGARRRQETRN